MRAEPPDTTRNVFPEGLAKGGFGAAQGVKVLRGTSPSVLPFEQAQDPLLLLNALTARKLGIVLPASLRARADRVVS